MQRSEIFKTYKLFINGEFPRTESGRHLELYDTRKKHVANICNASRKDFRNAVTAAYAALPVWAGKTAYNRSQILYRLGEMMEGRKDQLIKELKIFLSPSDAKKETEESIERVIYYAGFCDKYQSLASSVNPVSGPFFNFTVPEPTGIVSVICPPVPSLLGFISMVMPIVCGGNTCVVLASEKNPLPVLTLAEMIATSDIPKGVINILSGKKEELLMHFASHMEVNAFSAADLSDEEIKKAGDLCADTVKRFVHHSAKEFVENPGLYRILEFQEMKTTWHPVEKIISGSGKY